MPSDPRPHAPRPTRGPRLHILPHAIRRRLTPAMGGEHGAVRATAQPEESGHGAGDNWAALKMGAALLAGGALLAWILASLLA